MENINDMENLINNSEDNHSRNEGKKHIFDGLKREEVESIQFNDYRNEAFAISLGIQVAGFDSFKEKFKKKPYKFRTFKEYGYNITDENRDRVSRLDELVSEFNKLFENIDSVDENHLNEMLIEFNNICEQK